MSTSHTDADVANTVPPSASDASRGQTDSSEGRAATPGAASVTERVVPFEAGDGMALNLINVRPAEPRLGPVLLVHGAGVRANIFRPPGQTTFVDVLAAAGYDVWLENWRASIDVPPNEWTLDRAAVHDHPAAVRKVLEETGSSELKAVVHCQGSTSFVLSALAGLVPQVTTIVTNAVSLHPVVPKWSKAKLAAVVPLVAKLTPYVSPGWGLEAPTLLAKAMTQAVRATHHECDNTVCRLVSFVYGSGFPALWRHENLTDEVHDWLKHEFAEVPLSFFRQMARCVRSGVLAPVDGFQAIPSDFADCTRTDARFAFFTGEMNRCFLPDSQIRSWKHFDARRPGFHALHALPGYSHLDIFLGRNAAQDVFPLMLKELERPTG